MLSRSRERFSPQSAMLPEKSLWWFPARPHALWLFGERRHVQDSPSRTSDYGWNPALRSPRLDCIHLIPTALTVSIVSEMVEHNRGRVVHNRPRTTRLESVGNVDTYFFDKQQQQRQQQPQQRHKTETSLSWRLREKHREDLGTAGPRVVDLMSTLN